MRVNSESCNRIHDIARSRLPSGFLFCGMARASVWQRHSILFLLLSCSLFLSVCSQHKTLMRLEVHAMYIYIYNYGHEDANVCACVSSGGNASKSFCCTSTLRHNLIPDTDSLPARPLCPAHAGLPALCFFGVTSNVDGVVAVRTHPIQQPTYRLLSCKL